MKRIVPGWSRMLLESSEGSTDSLTTLVGFHGQLSKQPQLTFGTRYFRSIFEARSTAANTPYLRCVKLAGEVSSIWVRFAASRACLISWHMGPKGGLLALTRTLAGALAQDRIRVNCVIPGWVLTEGELALHKAQGRQEEALKKEGESWGWAAIRHRWTPGLPSFTCSARKARRSPEPFDMSTLARRLCPSLPARTPARCCVREWGLMPNILSQFLDTNVNPFGNPICG
jgi:hypothetical protein